jgi:hypothetical protein
MVNWKSSCCFILSLSGVTYCGGGGGGGGGDRCFSLLFVCLLILLWAFIYFLILS